MQRCLAGDATAWEALVGRYQRLVYAIVTRMGLDEHAAADVFQAVFEKLVQHLPRLREPDRLQAWIVTTAKREGLAARRRGQRQVSMTRPDDEDSAGPGEWDIADDSPGAEQQLDDLQQLHRLRLGLERLDERCRELLLLVFRDEDERLGYDENRPPPGPAGGQHRPDPLALPGQIAQTAALIRKPLYLPANKALCPSPCPPHPPPTRCWP